MLVLSWLTPSLTQGCAFSLPLLPSSSATSQARTSPNRARFGTIAFPFRHLYFRPLLWKEARGLFEMAACPDLSCSSPAHPLGEQLNSPGASHLGQQRRGEGVHAAAVTPLARGTLADSWSFLSFNSLFRY
jgi:hypothetical protein